MSVSKPMVEGVSHQSTARLGNTCLSSVPPSPSSLFLPLSYMKSSTSHHFRNGAVHDQRPWNRSSFNLTVLHERH